MSESVKSIRAMILDEAKRIVSKDRNTNYGEPEDNFKRIADLWATYLNVPIQPYDVAILMILLKVARITVSPQVRDHWIDLAGYAACGGEIAPSDS